MVWLHFLCLYQSPQTFILCAMTWILLHSPISSRPFCVLLYSSPYPLLLSRSILWSLIKRLENFSRCLKLIAKCSGISLTRLQEFVISKHLSSCELFANKIISDVQHTLHLFLSNSRLSRPGRSSYKHIYARTDAYENSVIPYLARF